MTRDDRLATTISNGCSLSCIHVQCWQHARKIGKEKGPIP
jgi:hypothetical protein